MRFYSSTAGVMELQLGITSGSTTIVVDTVVGLPGTTPYTLVVDVGQATEEIVEVTGAAGTTLTVTRGVDGSSAQAHSAGAQIRHMATARDFREAQEHIAASSGVHGATGSVVGTTDTQTLTHKNLTDATNTFPSSLATDAELSAHSSATAAHGASGAVVGTTNVQTLTNKTLSGASNTFSNIPESAVTSLTTDLGSLSTRIGTVETNLGSQTTFAATSASKDGKKIHWAKASVSPNGTGYATITHGAGFTPTVVTVTGEQAYYHGVDPANITATTFQVRVLTTAGVAATGPYDVMYACFE